MPRWSSNLPTMSSAERSMHTRNALLDSAKKVFGIIGYARTSHADIAA